LIELDPDISIGFTWDTVNKNDFGAIDESTLPGFLDVAPSLCILAVGAPIDVSIERFVELAAALGADTEADEVVAARDAFTAASEAVRAATAAKPDLTAIAMSGALENAWIGNPTVASDLVYFANLGLTFVIPETPQEYASGLWQQISWEQVGEYQADLYLLDNRPSSLPVDEYQDIPVVQLLPAFAAEQFTNWPVEYVFNYGGLTPTLIALAEAISSAAIVSE
jgi:iron complex transport system substrate-binding protein